MIPRHARFKLLCLTIALAVVCTAPPHAAAQQPATPPDLAAITTRLEGEVQEILSETGIPAISIALVQDGSVAWAGTFGYANVGASVPATSETYFSTGSTFKFVTATAMMQLVEKGELELDTPLNEIVGPELAIQGADDVTVRHLLSHHSGLRGPVGTVPLWSRINVRTPEDLLSNTRRIREPGIEYRYCNECFAIAGFIIERISGRTYDEYVAEYILQPIGVDVSLTSVPSPEIVEHLALPYNLESNRAIPISQVRYDVYAAGDIYLRAVDMARFLATQLNGGVYDGKRILSEASSLEMRRQQFGGQNYGLGTGMAERSGHDLVTHSGAIPGFNSMSIGEPSAGSGVYIMSNSGQSSKAIGPLARLAMELMWGEDPGPLASFASVEHTAVTISTDLFDEYVGEYELRPGFIISVTRDGNRFFVQPTEQRRIAIRAESDTDFFLIGVEASVTFGRADATGPVTHLILHQGGRSQTAERRR